MWICHIRSKLSVICIFDDFLLFAVCFDINVTFCRQYSFPFAKAHQYILVDLSNQMWVDSLNSVLANEHLTHLNKHFFIF